MRNPMHNNKRNTCRLGRRPDKKRSAFQTITLTTTPTPTPFFFCLCFLVSIVRVSRSLNQSHFQKILFPLHSTPNSPRRLALLACFSFTFLHVLFYFFLPITSCSSFLFFFGTLILITAVLPPFSPSPPPPPAPLHPPLPSPPSLQRHPSSVTRILYSSPLSLLPFSSFGRSCRHFFLIFSPIPVPPPPPPPPPFPPLPSVRLLCLISWMHLPYFMLPFYIRLPW